MNKFTKKEIEDYKNYSSKEEAKERKTINKNHIHSLNGKIKESLAKANGKFANEEDKKFFWDRIKKLNSQILLFEKENDLILKAYSI
jgi:hypothetical protein